jgi:hypothetical protein
MSAREEWGPWIDHDGQGAPQDIPNGAELEVLYEGDGLVCRPGSQITPNFPGWFWTWRRRFVLFGSVERQCIDPDFAPIVAYRIRRRATAVERLAAVANGAPIVNAPEGPVRTPQPSEVSE